MVVEHELQKIVALYQQEQFEPMLRAAGSLHGALIQAGDTSSANLGWARFYLFKAFYSTGRYTDAGALYFQQKSEPAQIDPANLAQMHSIAAELFVRLGATVEQVTQAAEDCLDVRRNLGDTRSAIQLCTTACNLLGLCDLEDRNEMFARQLINLGGSMTLPSLFVTGWEHLVDNILRSGRWERIPPIREEAIRRATPLALEGEDADRFRSAVLGRLDTPQALPSNATELQKFLAGGPELPGDPTAQMARQRYDEATRLSLAGDHEAALAIYEKWNTSGQKIPVSGEFMAKMGLRRGQALLDLGRFREAADYLGGDEMDTLKGQLATHDLFELAFALGNAHGALGEIEVMDRCMSYAMNLSSQAMGDTDRSARAWYWLLHWGVKHQAWSYLEENIPLAHQFGAGNQMYRVQHWAAEAWVRWKAATGERELAAKGAAVVLWRLRVAGRPSVELAEWESLAGG